MCSILDCYLNDCMTMQPITHLNPWILMCPMMVIPPSCVSVGIKIQIIFNSADKDSENKTIDTNTEKNMADKSSENITTDNNSDSAPTVKSSNRKPTEDNTENMAKSENSENKNTLNSSKITTTDKNLENTTTVSKSPKTTIFINYESTSSTTFKTTTIPVEECILDKDGRPIIQPCWVLG